MADNNAMAGLFGGLGEGFRTFLALQQAAEERDRQDAQRADASEFRDATAARQGLRRGTAPVTAPVFSGGTMGADGKMAPIAPSTTPSRYSQVTPNYYEDTQDTPEYHARMLKRLEAQAAGLKDERDFAQAKELKGIAPAGQGPAMGTPEWVAAQQLLSTLRQGEHQVNRRFDVAHPTKESGQGPRLTDGQRQVGALIPEIRHGAATLDAMGSPEALNTFATKAGTMGNFLKTEEGQIYAQAADLFLNNLIYAKSGKGVTNDEREGLWRTYIGVLGDSPKTIANKKRARDLAMQGLDVASGGSTPSRGTVQPQQGKAPVGPVTFGGDTAVPAKVPTKVPTFEEWKKSQGAP